MNRLARSRALLVLWLALWMQVSWAQESAQAAEYQVKAAFLYKFLNFVEWPPQSYESADSPLVIGVVGAAALAGDLAALAAKHSAGNRAIVVRQIRHDEAPTGVHMLFIGRTDNAHAGQLIGLAKGHPLLVVTESEDGLNPGSTINFVVVDNKVRFDVALRVAEAGNLKISSRLLAVARKVI